MPNSIIATPIMQAKPYLPIAATRPTPAMQ